MIKLLSVVVAVMVFDSFKPTEGDLSTEPAMSHIEDCWTEWFDRDDPPGSGDWETLSDLRKEYPGKICLTPSDIEYKTLSGLSAAEAGDTVFRGDVNSGFICRNADQPDRVCNDYKVRFKCQPPYCGGLVCWTKWYNRDKPGGSGDWETLGSLRRENPGELCDNPQNIEAVTTDTLTPALNTGEIIYLYSPTKGFVCRNRDQKSGTCRDYKVRFQCPCA